MAEPYLSQLQKIATQFGPLIDENITLEAKHFFSGGALYANGKICASLSPAGFAIKLPQGTRQNLLAEDKATEFRFFPDGPVKREYVALSDPVLEDEQILKELLELSAIYVVGQLN